MTSCPLPDVAEKLKGTPVGNKLQAIVDKQKKLNYKIDFNAMLGIEEADKTQTAANKADKARPVFDTLPENSSKPTMTYAGIGSRETPKEILELMTKAAAWLEGKGYTLRSGAAAGADTAFENGVESKKQIFKGFDKVGQKEIAIAHELYPDLQGAMDRARTKKIEKKLKAGASQEEAEKAGERSAWAIQNLMARNTNQIFGAKLDTPVDFVLFYAEENPKNKLRPKGGTGQAVEMARRKGIPTINMASADWRKQLTATLEAKKGKTTQEVKPTEQPKSTVDRFVVPEDITELKENEIFVFGSNLAGKHGSGAALTAKTRFGAEQGEGRGPKGRTYAIATKDKNIETMSYDAIGIEIEDFVEYAERNPDKTFLVTAIGTGLAGLKAEHILWYFQNIPDNIKLPKKWADVVPSKPSRQAAQGQASTAKPTINSKVAEADNKTNNDTISLSTLKKDVVKDMTNACKE